MNKKLSRIIGTALVIFSITLITDNSAAAQDEREKSENSSQARSSALLEGSWNVQVTRRNCETGDATSSFPTMSNFNRGGTMNDYGIAMAPVGRGPAFGVWSHQSGRKFTNKFQFFLFGADGATTGRQIVRRQIRVSLSGNEYNATGAVQVFNNAGNQIAVVCTTETATRFE